MTSGIRIYNDSNNLVIDENYQNLYVSRKVTLSGTGTTTGTFGSGEVMAAVGGVSGSNLDASCTNTATGWTCRVGTYVSGMCVYVLSKNIPKQDHGVGLQVFNTSGTLVYDSSVKFPKVLACGNTDTSLPGGNVIYAIACGAPINQWSQSTNHYVQQSNGIDVRTRTVTKHVWVDAVYGYKDGKYQIITQGHYEDQQVQETYYVYTCTWSSYTTVDTSAVVKNFRISSNTAKLVVESSDENHSQTYTAGNSGYLESETGYPKAPDTAYSSNTLEAYVVNPTSFIVFDVSGI